MNRAPYRRAIVATVPVTFDEVPVVFWFRTGTSDAAMVPHAGMVALVPDPVEVRNSFVAVVFPGTRTPSPEAVPAIMSPAVVIGFRNDTVDSHPAVTTCAIVKFAECGTGWLPSAPRITFHVVPVMLTTAMTSEGAAGSPTWNCVVPVEAEGHPVFDATTHVSGVPGSDGASVPPEMTVVEGLFSKTSVTATALPPPDAGNAV